MFSWQYAKGFVVLSLSIGSVAESDRKGGPVILDGMCISITLMPP